MTVNGKTKHHSVDDHSSATQLWWSMQAEARGITQPTRSGVRVTDMAAFIRDGIPLPRTQTPRNNRHDR
jgi:hypothetical protein